MWTIIYSLSILKQGQEDHFKRTNKEEEKKEDKEEEKKEEKEEEKKQEKIVEEIEQKNEKALVVEQQQKEQSVETTLVPSHSPPHTTPVEELIVKDVTKTTPQNINPLTAEDLKKILDQSTQ